MTGLRKLIGIVVLVAVACVGLPSAFAGPQESPGTRSTIELGGLEDPGPQESPGLILEIATTAATDVILPLILRVIP